MRPTPHAGNQANRVRLVTRHRRLLFSTMAFCGLAAVLAVVLSAGNAQEKTPPHPALARITGTNGGGTAVSVSDSTLLADARIFGRVGDTVSVWFASGSEFQGTVLSINWFPDSIGVSVVRLLGGAITPASAAIAPLSDANVFVLCVTGESQVLSLRVASTDVETASVIGWLSSGCGGLGAAVTQLDGTLGGLFLTSGTKGEPQFAAAASLPRP